MNCIFSFLPIKMKCPADLMMFLIFSTAQPVVTQRTRVVIEEIVDGKVVSRKEDVGKEVVKK